MLKRSLILTGAHSSVNYFEGDAKDPMDRLLRRVDRDRYIGMVQGRTSEGGEILTEFPELPNLESDDNGTTRTAGPSLDMY